MQFRLAEIEENDCTAFAIVDEAASTGWPLAKAMEQGMTSRREMFEQWFRSNRGTDPNWKWMKVVDSETGEMAAGALWRFPEDNAPTRVKSGHEEKTVEENAKQQAGNLEAIPPVFLEMGRRWKEFQDEFIGDRPFANLQVLVTHPKYQRKGAGSMLIKYGCDVADQKGVPCALTSSEAGYAAYVRHGFEVKKTYEMDLKPYGVDAVELRRGMIRPAKQK